MKRDDDDNDESRKWDQLTAEGNALDKAIGFDGVLNPQEITSMVRKINAMHNTIIGANADWDRNDQTEKIAMQISHLMLHQRPGDAQLFFKACVNHTIVAVLQAIVMKYDMIEKVRKPVSVSNLAGDPNRVVTDEEVLKMMTDDVNKDKKGKVIKH